VLAVEIVRGLGSRCGSQEELCSAEESISQGAALLLVQVEAGQSWTIGIGAVTLQLVSEDRDVQAKMKVVIDEIEGVAFHVPTIHFSGWTLHRPQARSPDSRGRMA
jgi:hypothetical protein